MNKQTFTFRRVERECSKNAILRAEGATRGFIYDYDVMLGEERVACFIRYRAWYELHDRDGRAIVRPGREHATHLGEACQSKEEFLGVLKTVRIPTAAECEKRAKQEQRVAALQERMQRKQERLQRIQAAGPRLLVALKQCLYEPAKVTTRRHRQIETLIQKLEA